MPSASAGCFFIPPLYHGGVLLDISCSHLTAAPILAHVFLAAAGKLGNRNLRTPGGVSAPAFAHL